jgi:hypothetical protein
MAIEGEVDLDREVRDGQTAKTLLDHPLLKNAFEQMEERLSRSWRDSKPGDVELRERCWRMLHAVRAAKKGLTELVTTGRMAAITLSDAEEREHSRSGSES